MADACPSSGWWEPTGGGCSCITRWARSTSAAPEGRLTPAAEALPLDVFIVSSPDPKVILGEYARITGRAELPPLWSFGYLQSHRTLAGPDEVMWVAKTFREKQLPCDGLIYLGTEFTPSGWNTRNGEFGWKKENFPDPKKAIDDLHALHYKVVLHSVIEGRRMSGTVAGSCTPDKAVPSGRTPDDRWPEDRAVECYWPYHKPAMDLGVDGWWPDQGDGLDGRSRLARIRMYWEGPQLYRPNERPFALHRNGYSGMQRYGAFLWSGDVYSTWETLKTHVPVAVNTGLSGIPYWGTDIGGFVPTPEYTGELHVRWFQFGTFCPLFRSHGRTWHLRLPWGWNTGSLGPDELRGYTGGAGHPDPSELRNAQVEPILRKYLELRYRLLPYTYTLAQECCDSGLPMMRSLWLHYPEDASAVARGDQFLWGRDVLVSPVVEKGAAARRLYLPKGAWHDYWTEERVEGGREIERAVDLGTMPLHVRAGAIIPHAPVRQYVDQPSDEPLTRRRLSGRGWRLRPLRRRWPDIRVSQGRVHADRDGVGRPGTPVVDAAGAGVAHAGANGPSDARARGGIEGRKERHVRRPAPGGDAVAECLSSSSPGALNRRT